MGKKFENSQNRQESSSDHKKLVAVGRIIKARGLRGELKFELLSDFSERFGSLDSVFLELKNGSVKSFDVEDASIRGQTAIIKLKGVDDRETADALRGAYISVAVDEVVPLEVDSFYIFDLEGMDVFTQNREKIGKVVSVEQYPANDVLVVESEIDRIMIPAIKEFIISVDVHCKRLTVDIPEGLPTYPKGSG